MVVAEVRNGQLEIIDRLREMVQLAAGLDEQNRLSSEAQERALHCLKRFSGRLAGIPSNRIRAVGTNALRRAINATDFITQASTALGHPVEIISGQEEARLIYLGVSNNLANPDGRQLVIDIGGGSTELIIGQQHDPLLIESLPLGCISYTQKYFPDGLITESSMVNARQAAATELATIQTTFQELGWQRAIGCSGTVKALAKLAHRHGFSAEGTITYTALTRLSDLLLTAPDSVLLNQPTDVEARLLSVLPGGLCILLTCMEQLGLETLQLSNQALREGLLHDLLSQVGSG